MSKICTFILLFIVTSGNVFAQEDDGILWEITGNDAKKSYILGTCHAVEGDFLDSIPGFATAWFHAEKIMTECEVNRSLLTKIENSGENATEMPSDTTYAMLLDSADLAKLDSLFHGVFSTISKLKPIVITPFVKQMMNGTSKSVSTKKSQSRAYMDAEIQLRCRENGKISAYCETHEVQLNLNRYTRNIMINIPLDQQAKMLHNVLINNNTVNRNKNNQDDLVRKYKAGSIRFVNMDELLTDTEGIMLPPDIVQKIYDMAFTNRNNRWMPIIEKHINEAPTLIAVGFGHLIGANGLIAQLRKQGYIVNPITKEE